MNVHYEIDYTNLFINWVVVIYLAAQNGNCIHVRATGNIGNEIVAHDVSVWGC